MHTVVLVQPLRRCVSRQNVRVHSCILALKMNSHIQACAHQHRLDVDVTLVFAGIVQQRILTDRQHILLKDSSGDVHLWDALKGAIVHSYGKVDFEAQALAMFRPVSVANWFAADHKLGCVSLHLDYPSCFHAEVSPGLGLDEGLGKGIGQVDSVTKPSCFHAEVSPRLGLG